jgi:ribosomal protein S18 acetylase RimI-like enzyme
VADRATLLRATAANHRAWFRRCAAVAGGHVERVAGLELVVTGQAATMPFPAAGQGLRRRLDELMRDADERGVRAIGCWALDEDRRLGTVLLARGFEWGWQPHWMALDLRRLPDEPLEHDVAPAERDGASDLPYGEPGPVHRATAHLAVRDDGRTVGHVALNPWRGCAGIYDMGVVPSHRRRGIGRALTLAACRLGRERGCTHAVLNATGDGEPLYRALGFQSLGMGRTWWLHPGPRPTARQTELAEALGLGDAAALASLAPTDAELEEPIPGGGPPLAIAVVTRRPAVADWILDRRPDLASRPVEPRGGTLLHVAVEWNDEDLVGVALRHGADRSVRDGMWHGTPLDWARHLDRPRLAALLEQQAP